MAEHAPAATRAEEGHAAPGTTELKAGTADHGGGHVEPTAWFFDASGWVALAMLAVFAVLVWKRVPAAIGQALDRRIGTIRQQIDEAARLRAEAEALRAEYAAKTKRADGEVAAMLDRARSEADAIVAKAETDAAALVERRGRIAEDKIAAAERAALDEVRARTASAAAAAAETLIRDRLDARADKAIVDSAIDDLGR
ncbi:MAG: F0F1 ATP synthase subunit B family protein [Sphingosinicella sp.]